MEHQMPSTTTDVAATNAERTEAGKPSFAEIASDIINGARRSEYGSPRESFERIAALWSAYIGHEISWRDVAHMMILLKVSRTKQEFHADSYVDIIGYTLCVEEING